VVAGEAGRKDNPSNERVLAWEGCTNVRDLGGLCTDDGRTTRFRALARSDNPARLIAAGWSALYDYGIRTLVTLRTHGRAEDNLNVTPPYPDLAVIQVAIEDITDAVFLQRWAATGLWCTPLYYQDALQRWPQRHAAAISAISQARPGGVLFHCVLGIDRMGIITLLLLSLAGVTFEDIVANYVLSHDSERNALLALHHSSSREAIQGALAGFDLEDYLRRGGASRADLSAVRQLLLNQAVQA